MRLGDKIISSMPVLLEQYLNQKIKIPKRGVDLWDAPTGIMSTLQLVLVLNVLKKGRKVVRVGFSRLLKG
jgi:hypothetical protein